jgi:hypothetical protein
MVELPDPKLLKAVQERDEERGQRIRYQRAAHALKLQVDQLRRQVRQLALDRAVVVNRASRDCCSSISTRPASVRQHPPQPSHASWALRAASEWEQWQQWE